jgi:hypothetical protein
MCVIEQQCRTSVVDSINKLRLKVTDSRFLQITLKVELPPGGGAEYDSIDENIVYWKLMLEKQTVLAAIMIFGENLKYFTFILIKICQPFWSYG